MTVTVNRTRTVALYKDPTTGAAAVDKIWLQRSRTIAAYRGVVPVTFEAVQLTRSAVKVAYRYTEPPAPSGGNAVIICITS